MFININNNRFRIKTVFSKKDTSKGMMGKKFDNTFNGMLFLMNPGEHAFWMKNCLVFLDIIFINDNIITKIHHNCPPCETEDCPNYFGTGDTILELKGNTCKKLGIREGDEVSF
jgi:uncharacterized membrane protein (UPF0127 family)